MTKILILNTGGTIAMTGRPAYPFYSGEELYLEIPKPEDAKLGFRAYNNLMDSSDLQSGDREFLFDMLCEEYAKYDAFVLLHGSDTLDLTAAYLSIVFGNDLQKPIFLIASAKMPDEKETDALRQLHDGLAMADLFARQGYIGVYTISAGKVLNGNRVCKRLDAGDDIFHTPGLQHVAEVRHNVLHPRLLRERSIDALPQQSITLRSSRLAREVSTFNAVADEPPFVFMAACAANLIKGAILIGKGDGNISSRPFKTWAGDNGHSWISAIEDATSRNIAVGVRAPFEGASFNMQRYPLGKKALQAGAVSLSGLTPAMADIKFRYALARYGRHLGHIRKYLDEDPLGKLPTTKQVAA